MMLHGGPDGEDEDHEIDDLVLPAVWMHQMMLDSLRLPGTDPEMPAWRVSDSGEHVASGRCHDGLTDRCELVSKRNANFMHYTAM